MSGQSEQAPDQEREGYWYFTFGHGHKHGPNGYVVITGTFASARAEMFRRFGSQWCMQYEEAKALPMIERWHMRKVDA